MTTYAPPGPRARRPPRAPRRRPPVRRAPQRRAAIDPRLRARRIAVARDQGRRRLRRLLVALAGLGIAAAAAGAMFSPLLDVDRIEVMGATGGLAARVRGAAGDEEGQPLLFVDTGAVEARVEALPGIADATVDRDLPGALVIRVTARPPVAWVQARDGSIRVLDARGVVLSAAPAPPAGLPGIAGAPIDPAATRAASAAARVASDLTPALRARVAGIVVVHGVAALRLVDGPDVRLGAPRQIAAKTHAAEAVLAALGPTRVAYIDVSVPSAPVAG